MTPDKKESLSNLLLIAGLLLMVIMAVLPMFNNLIEKEWMLWAYTAGALIVLVSRFVGYDNETTLRVKRLQHLLILSALLYCASASVKFIPEVYKNWIALLLAGLAVQIYASWMIDRESKKAEK
ncbi:MAG: hypothetical protein IJV05_07305 [Muribaculaceae bacterium]|nr:hypothetical protein [Muribaculaceae bacterium]